MGVILVGDNPASKSYVANKEKFAARCGIKAFDKILPSDASVADVERAILEFNRTPEIDGILLQLPLPSHLKANPLISLIDPKKDADGLHPVNQGLLMRGEGSLRPCTPVGVLKFVDLAFSSVESGAAGATLSNIKPADLSGKMAVVIGRSILVGKPVSLLLQERNATVIMAHSKTKDLASVVRQGDVVVAAVGVPHLVKGDWIKEGAVVIDVGINRMSDGKLTGDVEFPSAAQRASAITPVPGGAGPMTVAMLIHNTLQAYLRANGL